MPGAGGTPGACVRHGPHGGCRDPAASVKLGRAGGKNNGVPSSGSGVYPPRHPGARAINAAVLKKWPWRNSADLEGEGRPRQPMDQ